MHPLLKWTLYGWLMALVMASVILLSGYLPFRYSALTGAALAYILRCMILRQREMLAFRKMTRLVIGRTSPTSGWKLQNDWPMCLCLVISVLGLGHQPAHSAAAIVFAAIPFSRMVASQLVLMLPYRGRAEAAPARYDTTEGLLLFAAGMICFAPLLWISGGGLMWLSRLIFVPCLVMYGLYMLLARRLRGFTYDSLMVVAMMVETALITTMVVTEH